MKALVPCWISKFLPVAHIVVVYFWLDNCMGVLAINRCSFAAFQHEGGVNSHGKAETLNRRLGLSRAVHQKGTSLHHEVETAGR